MADLLRRTVGPAIVLDRRFWMGNVAFDLIHQLKGDHQMALADEVVNLGPPVGPDQRQAC